MSSRLLVSAGTIIISSWVASAEIASSVGPTIRFEANEGQVSEEVRFIGRGFGRRLVFLNGGDIVIGIATEPSHHHQWDLTQFPRDQWDLTQFPREEPDRQTDQALIRLRWMSTGGVASVRPEYPLGVRSSFFTGADPNFWHVNVTSYETIALDDPTTGLQVHLYGTQQQLILEEVVPHVPPLEDMLTAEDQSGAPLRITLGDNDELQIDGSTGRLGIGVYIRSPVSSHPEQTVRLADAVSGSTQSRLSTQTCRSALKWAKYFGGDGNDRAREVAVDLEGNSYVVGVTTSLQLFSDASTIDQRESDDVFVLKMASEGQEVLYSAFVGGSGRDVPQSVSLDADGNVHVVGFTDSSDFPTSLTAEQREFGGGSLDGFALVLSNDGSRLLHSTYLGGDGPDTANSIAFSREGDTYVGGLTGSSDFPRATGLQKDLRGNSDGFIVVLRGDHLAARATYFGGSSDDSLETLAVAHDGTVVGFGATVSDDLPTLNAAQDVSGGSTDTFIVRFQPDLSELVFSTYLGGNGIDRAGPRGLAVDARGAILVTGGTDSRNFPTVRPIQSRYNGGAEDAFVATLAPNGNLAFSTFLGGGVGLFELGVAAVFDQIGGIHVAGVTSSVDFPTKRAQQEAYGGGFSDVFLLGLRTAGELSYSTYLGGSGTDDIHGMAVDASGALRLVGMTTSSDFPAAQGQPGGGSDGFMAAIDPPHCHCRGDCDDNAAVTVGEVVLAVNIMLESLPLTRCSALDANGDGVVVVAELVGAVNALINGCP